MSGSVQCDELFVATKDLQQIYSEHDGYSKRQREQNLEITILLHSTMFKLPKRFWYIQFFHKQGNKIHKGTVITLNFLIH